MKKRYLATLPAVLAPASAFALESWEPLITAQHFTGIRADILLAVSGILGILLIILGLKALSRIF